MNKSNHPNFLPIGSVVLLRDGNKPLMVYGRKQINSINNQEYDYVACLYPEGNISNEYNYFFSKNDIEKVLFVGYETKEEKLLRTVL